MVLELVSGLDGNMVYELDAGNLIIIIWIVNLQTRLKASRTRRCSRFSMTKC